MNAFTHGRYSVTRLNNLNIQVRPTNHKGASHIIMAKAGQPVDGAYCPCQKHMGCMHLEAVKAFVANESYVATQEEMEGSFAYRMLWA